ncbi:MAG: hypothetical protein R3F19_33620 [Verrucomicrobiales bacterium]
MSKTKPKTWLPTKHEHLYRHKSGNYYVRLGHRTWRSLQTKLISVALIERDKWLEAERARSEMNPHIRDAKDHSMAGNEGDTNAANR